MKLHRALKYIILHDVKTYLFTTSKIPIVNWHPILIKSVLFFIFIILLFMHNNTIKIFFDVSYYNTFGWYTLWLLKKNSMKIRGEKQFPTRYLWQTPGVQKKKKIWVQINIRCILETLSCRLSIHFLHPPKMADAQTKLAIMSLRPW